MRQFFTDDNGRLSMTRLTTFILVITAVLLSFTAAWLVIAGKVIVELTYLIGVLLGFGLGSKITQKFAEKETTIN